MYRHISNGESRFRITRSRWFRDISVKKVKLFIIYSTVRVRERVSVEFSVVSRGSERYAVFSDIFNEPPPSF